MRPTIRQLEYAVAVAEHNSFSRAADACGISQPGLSAQVARLEETLGVVLFERRPRTVVPTEAGRSVIEAARRVIAEVDGLVRAASTRQDPLDGTIRLGVIPTIAPYLLPVVMPAVREHFPALRLLLHEERTDSLREKLNSGELDLGLVALESELGDLETLPLFEDPFLLAVSGDHRLAGVDSARPDDLFGEEVLLLEDGHCLRQQTSPICDAAGACELGDFRATSLGTLLQMVGTGVGVTLVPNLATRDASGPIPSLRLVPFRDPPPGRTVALAWRRSSPHAKRFTALGEALIPAGAQRIEARGAA